MTTCEIAKKWRHENGYIGKGGVVVVFLDVVAGWMNQLRSPEHWMPGCVAVSENAVQYKAVGGDKQNGAKEWQIWTEDDE